MEGFPNRKKATTFEVFQRGCSDRRDAGETLNSGARTKGVLEPRLSGLGLRESFCFLGMVSNHEMETYQDTHPKILWITTLQLANVVRWKLDNLSFVDHFHPERGELPLPCLQKNKRYHVCSSCLNFMSSLPESSTQDVGIPYLSMCDAPTSPVNWPVGSKRNQVPFRVS